MDSEKIHQEYQKVMIESGYYSWTNRHVLEISGKDSEKFLHNLLSQHIQEQKVGERRWSTLLNSKGRLIGFFEVWKLTNQFLLVVSDEHKEQVFKTLDMYLITENVSMKWLTNLKIVSIFKKKSEPVNRIVEANTLSCYVDDFFIPSTTMFLTSEQLEQVVSSTHEISDELFESVRIHSGLPLPIVDYEDPIPIEVPFMHRAVSFTKGCYVGQETIARLHARGLNVSRKLLAFSFKGSFVSSRDLIMCEGNEVGKITSVAASPLNDEMIGLAWIHRNAFGKTMTVNGQTMKVKYE